TDFGIAKMVEGATMDLTGTGIIGTPQYMSPEQCRGDKNLTPASDVYALGVVLYEMVTGTTPFQADTPLAVIHMQVSAPLPPPHTIRPDITDAIEAVIFKALAKQPESRFSSCTALAEAFARAVAAYEDPAADTARSGSRATKPVSETVVDAETPTTYVRESTSRPKPIWAIAGVIGLLVVAVIAGIATGVFGGGGSPTPTTVEQAALDTPVPAQTDAPTEEVGTAVAMVIDSDEALASFNQAIEAAPNNVQNYVQRGDLYFYTLQDLDSALADYNRALELDPDSSWALSSRGELHFALGDNENAVADLTRAIELDPSNGEAYIALGEIYFDEWNSDEALETLTQAIENNPSLVEAY